MKIWLCLVYADGDVAATLLRPWRWSYAFVALLYHFYYGICSSDRLLLRPGRFYCALAVSATIRVILTKISNRSGIAVQWMGGGGGLPIFIWKCLRTAQSFLSGRTISPSGPLVQICSNYAPGPIMGPPWSVTCFT